MKSGTYGGCVVDEVVQPGVAEDGREPRWEAAHVVEVGHVELHNVQSPLRALF